MALSWDQKSSRGSAEPALMGASSRYLKRSKRIMSRAPTSDHSDKARFGEGASKLTEDAF
jgi:hypothetical protein